jgi:hypothetical protein
MADTLSLDVYKILLSAVITENTVELTCGDLGEEYKKVDAVLKRCGGKWNTSKKLHTFARTTEILKIAMDTMTLPPINPLAFFPTPLELVEILCANSGAYRSMKTLEPSAGHGAIAKYLRDENGLTNEDLDLIEIDPYNCIELREQGFNPHNVDFMDWKPDYQYDCVVMNPPFSYKGDPNAHVAHFLHAYDMWNSNGNFVAILPPTHILKRCFTHERTNKGCDSYSSNPKIRRYQDIIEGYGHTHTNPSKSFAKSGTNIDTVTVLIHGG